MVQVTTNHRRATTASCHIPEKQERFLCNIMERREIPDDYDSDSYGLILEFGTSYLHSGKCPGARSLAS